VTPEDLIVMKAVANRPRDLIDIASVVEAQPDLDVARVRRWVHEFADALETPEILGELNRILSQRKR
jgi:hypothetical protein